MITSGPQSGTGESYGSAPGDPGVKAPARSPWIVLSVTVVLMAVGRYLEYRVNGEPPDGWLADSVMGLAFMSFPAVGALVASRRKATAFGWLLLGIGAAAAVLVAASGYASWRVPAGHTDPVTVFAAWIYGWLWFPLIVTIPTFLFLLFPTGSYPSPRWRWVGRVALVFIILVTVPSMLEDRLEVEQCSRHASEQECTNPSIDNPIGVAFVTDAEEQLGFLFVGVLPVVLLSIASLFFRYRSADAVQRQQMKWVGVAALFFGASLLFGDFIGVSDRLFPFFLMMLPLSMAVSILKYRLYEIDVIINRALVYGALSAVLIGAYLAIVVALQSLLGTFTEDSDIAVAGSTLVVAALFRPVRSYVQDFIDRRFYRRKFDAQLTLESFSSRLRDDVDLEHLAHDLAIVVRDTMQPAHVSVWLRPHEEPATS